MSAIELQTLSEQLRSLPGLRSKRDIQEASTIFEHHPFPELGDASRLGDDTALIPPQLGSLLLACEGMQPELVIEDPWFAGWSGVLVNLSDIAAMGGRPLALVNSLWGQGDEAGQKLLEGMRFACDKFAVPMVGGHTNNQSPYSALSVSVLGMADGPVLSARAAQPGDALVFLIDGDGSFYRHYPFWDAATKADPERLRAQLSLLPKLAHARIARAAKDISMGGLVGTAVMFSEACGLQITIDLDAIPRPVGINELSWLSCFPSFGFLLAIPQTEFTSLRNLVNLHSCLMCETIGRFEAQPSGVWLERDSQTHQIWDEASPLTGFGAVATP
ncbi:sll0787 family AIR synthase-like protein [Vulcanococcus sp.]|uniref:sll0787 family AIR synthase-like protein n=1 Tax=Vulcanococcus sp. TaxID=2856995 RepID=UPI003F695A1A